MVRWERAGRETVGHAMHETMKHALRLWQHGVVPLPLCEGGKHLDLSQMGYEPMHLSSRSKLLKELAFRGIAFHLSQRPPEPSTVEGWFSSEKANIGILGGFAELIILDFDRMRGFERWRKQNAKLVARTPVERSPRGVHVYLRCSEPTVSTSLYFGLRKIGHVKALGGYAVTAPSVLRNGGTYRWLPGQSLLDLEPQKIRSLATLGLRPLSPLKHCYDRVLNRGGFVPG